MKSFVFFAVLAFFLQSALSQDQREEGEESKDYYTYITENHIKNNNQLSITEEEKENIIKYLASDEFHDKMKHLDFAHLSQGIYASIIDEFVKKSRNRSEPTEKKLDISLASHIE